MEQNLQISVVDILATVRTDPCNVIHSHRFYATVIVV